MSSSNIAKSVLLSSNSGQVRSQNSEISSSAASDLVENRLKFEHSIDHNIVSLHVEAHKKRLKKLRKELNYLQETAWKYQSIEKVLECLVMSIVTVLTPNGRRQNVKITPNTTLLQVLEEVCQKHGFKPQDYDIRHHNKILDVSCIFQFSGLPNNALLEMIEAKKQRSESSVVLGLQLESGDRLTGEFTPSENLWNVILSLNPREAKSFESPAVIYMRKEICGKENLERTTLRSLGLTGGRAVLRFFNRTPEELRTQANVSAVITRSTVSKDRKINSVSPERQVKAVHHPQFVFEKLQEKKTESIHVNEEEEEQQSIPSFVNEDKLVSKKTGNKIALPSDNKVTTHKTDDLNTVNDNERESNVEKNVNDKTNSAFGNGLHMDLSDEERSKVILLGERNAVAYNLNKVKPTVFEEVPDEFYDLTVSDAKLLLRDAKQLCSDLEDAPLMTSAQRELEKNKKILSLLNQYKKTVLRIKFPDRTVLQGTFSSVEKISAVEKFVADYLENPDTSFYLYTTPPKEILKSDCNLLESNCVPCAVLYFGVSSSVTDSKQFLRTDVLQKFSSPSAAALTAYRSRGLISNTAKDESEGNKIITKDDSVSVAGPSNPATSSEEKQVKEQGSSPPFKVPKWFKMKK